MKEELIRVLNYKLNDINADIEALENLNNKIEEEREKSTFVEEILNIFKEGEGNNLLNFVKISKDDFDRVLDIAGEETRTIFSGDSCNYDGLVYLINGINNGVSLTLTDEQTNGIEYLIKTITDRKKEFDSAVDGYTLVKSRYEINDVDELKEKKENYNRVLNGIGNNDYIKDTDLLTEAIKFSSVSPQETIDLLTYVLEYNAEVYGEGRPVYREEEKHEEKEEVKEEPPVETKEVEEPTVENYYEENYPEETSYEDNVVDNTEFHFNDLNDDNLYTLPNVTFDEDEKEEVKEESYDEPETTEYEEEADYQEYQPYEETNEEEKVQIPDELTYVPATDDIVESPIEDNVDLDTYEEHQEEPEEEKVEEVKEEIPVETEVHEEVVEEPTENVDDDFKDLVEEETEEEHEEYEREEKTSTRELQKIFSKYGIEENTILNELIDGNVDDYQNILDALNDNSILEYFRSNRELLVETLLYSDDEAIKNILKIVREDLSVDDEDYVITLKIVINTIPSIFVKDGGNYNNFVKNVDLFKQLGINLINLFDFSKEVFVADNESIKGNVDIINKYGFDITYKNAKYFLLIPNVADRIDYYIESVYEDKEKKQTFDGINYIKEYTAKLNVVTDETIKRLRYSSENGKKVFGSKPGSLSGEITNLKVNALDISGDYMNKFFDNEFANLTGDEVREYIKLIHNSSNVGDYSDELDKLNKYRDGLRYDIDGIKVSCNKVMRNYSILRSYGIDTKKALQFAVCYNLIITKDEYDKLNSLLDKIGGNE